MIGLLCMLVGARALEIGTYTQNYLPPLPLNNMGNVEATKVTIDANWRWLHDKGSYTNCFTSDWVKSFCPDPITCSQNCALEGVDAATYAVPYGVSVSGDAMTLRYVTKGPYGTNIGSRLYLVDSSGQNYKMFKLKNRQFSFDVDVSQIPCGINGALYFVEMAANGGKNALNKPGAPYGTGYGDAQCPTDIKYINGFANTNNTGICSHEMDIWEANSMATAFTPHTCSIKGVTPCGTAQECGRDPYRYDGYCDKDGADYNPYRVGDTGFYGPGVNFKVNTLKPFTVATQFITTDGTDSGDLTAIRRYYIQDGKTIEGYTMTDANIAERKAKFSETNHFEKLGGMKGMGQSMDRGMVLALSLWDDSYVSMLWLDSTYPVGSTAPGAVRGPCPTGNRDINYLRSTYPNSRVIYSKLTLSAIPSSSAPTDSPSSPPSNPPSNPPSAPPSNPPSNPPSAPPSNPPSSPPSAPPSNPPSSPPSNPPSAPPSNPPSSPPSNPPSTPPSNPPSRPPSSAPTKAPSASGSCSAAYGQCGGQSWNGPTCCVVGFKCVASNAYYSQCVPDTSVRTFRCLGCVLGTNWTCTSCQ